ncbi:MAG: hypothetical protein VB074_17145 [Proteiniphilum sp.]|jgi:hypothetical protein|uniref:hypothetical protein n=1 Tax=Proteiniphilum sp. TaxID=1926877 RepID=UPI00092BFA14|nr:hypothetical protein [Proteiniphilum sp.]MEA5129903.1 hypothetical protein [Proteiniphilum sp.]OJV79814.1 MAG: hypothetical protein BGO34_20075 [Bacteroidia bacterium 44-10]
MKLIYKIVFMTGVFSLLLISCNDDEYGSRKESTPIVESAAVSPTSFTFGDSIKLTATITDPATTLSILAYEVVSENKVLASGEIPIGGNSHEVSQAIFVPLLNNQADNAEVQVNLVARNILKGFTTTQITGLTGNRPVYNQLYLVTDNGGIAILKPQTSDKNKYLAEELTFDTSFRFKIAEKLNADNTIDYSGDVYGNANGRIAMINESGESAFVYAPSADYTKELIFDQYAFSVTTTGSDLIDGDLALSLFANKDINGESFRVHPLTLENGKTYSVFGELADARNLFNPDFFERTATDKVTFLGKTGDYTIYYNPVRKNTFVGVDNPSYPDYLLACGWGLGYPTYVTSAQIASIYPGKGRTHTDWGFDHVMKYVLLRQIRDGVYQGTFYTPGDHDHYAGFKPFENTGWGNEKKAGQFTFTGEQIISGSDNWDIPNGENDPLIESAHYRFTINLNDNTVHIEKVTL